MGFPSEKASAACVEPYNCVFATTTLITEADSVVMLDNQAIYGLCRERLQIRDLSYQNINRVIAQVISSVTLSLRFNSMLNVDLSQFHTNLVPYPKLHFFLSSLAPLSAPGRDFFQGLTERQITNDVFDPKAMMVKCDPTKGHYMAACVMYRGDINHSEVSKTCNDVRTTRNFVDWCPTGFKIGISKKKMVSVPGDNMLIGDKAGCMVGNNTAITEIFSRVDAKYDSMYEKRAFVHWFIADGMEEGEFPDARENIDTLKADYAEVLKMETAANSENGDADL